MDNQTTMIIDYGNQIAFSHLIVHIDFRAVHHIALPQVVGQLGFKLATIHRPFYRQIHQVLLV